MNQESVNQTIQEIRKLTDKPLRFMVNTHSDGDHVNGNRFFPESVVFVAHENCRNEFFHTGRNGEPSSWNDPELAPFIPSVTFSNKMDLYVDSKKVSYGTLEQGTRQEISLSISRMTRLLLLVIRDSRGVFS